MKFGFVADIGCNDSDWGLIQDVGKYALGTDPSTLKFNAVSKPIKNYNTC